MSDDLTRIGAFSEQGRGLPLNLARPGGALPFSPLVRQAYAPQTRARLGWGQGVITCADVPLNRPRAITSAHPPAAAARYLRDEESGYVPILTDGKWAGVVYWDDLLGPLVDGKAFPPTLAPLVSTSIPVCAPQSYLVDAVRQMLACSLLHLPVVSTEGEFVGLLPLATASAAAERDPAVRDVIETAALSPSLFARRWR